MERVKEEELRTLVKPAISGDERAILRVIELFMPQIISKSFYNGKFNEDIKAEIISKLYIKIPKFELR